MFIKEVSEYDLNNDFQRTLFFKYSLDGYMVIKLNNYSSGNWNELKHNKWLQGKGPSYNSMCLSFKNYVDIDGYGDWQESELDDLDMVLYEIMVEIPKYIKSLEKKHEEYKEWISSGGDPRHAGSYEFPFHPYSDNEVKDYSFYAFEMFKKHFSTEENILQTLDHLSRIMKVEKMKERMKKEMMKKKDSDNDQ